VPRGERFDDLLNLIQARVVVVDVHGRHPLVILVGAQQRLGKFTEVHLPPPKAGGNHSLDRRPESAPLLEAAAAD